MMPKTRTVSWPRLLFGLLLALTTTVLPGCGGGGTASLPASTTPAIDSFTANGVAVTFLGASVPVVAAPTNSLTSLVCTAHDPNHSPLMFAWTGITGAVTTQNNISTAGDTPTTVGDTLVTCTVTNARGNSTSATVTLRAGTPVPPTLTLGLSPASETIAVGKTDLLTAIAVDTSPVTYHFSVITGKGTVVQSATKPAQATFTAPAAAESDTVLCYATDTLGNSRTATAVILVK